MYSDEWWLRETLLEKRSEPPDPSTPRVFHVYVHYPPHRQELLAWPPPTKYNWLPLCLRAGQFAIFHRLFPITVGLGSGSLSGDVRFFIANIRALYVCCCRGLPPLLHGQRPCPQTNHSYRGVFACYSCCNSLQRPHDMRILQCWVVLCYMGRSLARRVSLSFYRCRQQC